jgi:hypothetical protein
MINVITHTHKKTQTKNINTMISPSCQLPAALILWVSAIAVCCAVDQSPQHSNVIIIDETNIFFILLTIILQASDRRTC